HGDTRRVAFAELDGPPVDRSLLLRFGAGERSTEEQEQGNRRERTRSVHGSALDEYMLGPLGRGTRCAGPMSRRTRWLASLKKEGPSSGPRRSFRGRCTDRT